MQDLGGYDPYLEAEAILTEEERTSFLAVMVRADPRWDGAHAADILAILHDEDRLTRLGEPWSEGEPIASNLARGGTRHHRGGSSARVTEAPS